MIDSQFRDTLANRFDIPRVPGCKSFDPCLDARSRLKIAQGVEPLGEHVGFPQFDHRRIVALWLQIVNAESIVRLAAC